MSIVESNRPDDDQIPLANLDFVECDSCRSKPGTPALCASCLHNREVIIVLKQTLRRIRKLAKRGKQQGRWHHGSG